MSATDAGAAFPYATYLDIKFDPLKLIDVPFTRAGLHRPVV